MKLIVGLGNPGTEYENTRHNIGFMILDNFVGNVRWKKNKIANYYKTKIADNDVLFLKPLTFMNLSGQAVSYFLKYYKIKPSDLLVIHDDMDLIFGKIRIKNNSSAGGHNGIKSIINELNNKEFYQLKFGISHPQNDNVIDYVLQKFSQKELDIIDSKQQVLKNIINDFIINKNKGLIINDNK